MGIHKKKVGKSQEISGMGRIKIFWVKRKKQYYDAKTVVERKANVIKLNSCYWKSTFLFGIKVEAN